MEAQTLGERSLERRALEEQALESAAEERALVLRRAGTGGCSGVRRGADNSRGSDTSMSSGARAGELD